MRAYLPDYELSSPGTLDGVLTAMRDDPQRRPLAGGTDIMVVFAAGELPAGRYVSVWELDELRGITVDRDEVRLGALTTYTDVREHAVVSEEFPMLAEAAALSGAAAIQNRGTLGGNIANASPAADSPPAMLAYDAQLRLVSAGGDRTVSYRGFHCGYKQMDLQPGELIHSIILPRPANDALHYYRKVGTRRAQAIAKVGLAAIGRNDRGCARGIRLGFSSVAPIPLVATATESAIEGKQLDHANIKSALGVLERELKPIDDVRSTATYRHRVALNLVADFLKELAAVRG